MNLYSLHEICWYKNTFNVNEKVSPIDIMEPEIQNEK